MSKKLEIYQIDAFTNHPFMGNPAAVLFGDGLRKKEMQLIAREMNLAETAFISKTKKKANYNLRWFTPAMEVDLCGHATIASLHFLNEHNLLKNNSEIKFDTLSGILKCKFEEGKYYMQIPIFNMKKYPGKINNAFKALGISSKESDNNIPALILDNGYLYIYIKKLKTVKELNPDFKAIAELYTTNKVEGIVVYTKETFYKNSFAHIRFFAPYYGINEDPVTGSANGPLILVLFKVGFIKDKKQTYSFTFEQGDCINRKGRIGVHYTPLKNELFISGKATTVLKGEINF
jgi:PhzF family phenazine biosynthesis protein